MSTENQQQQPAEKRKNVIVGLLAIIGICSLIGYCTGGDKPAASSSSSSYSSSPASSSVELDCPHCGGFGKRMNSITQEYRSCASCGGDGKVSQEQYGRLSK